MFRLVSARLPLAAVAASASARFQSTAVASQRNNQRRPYPPVTDLPKFEIHDVRDTPENGTMTRVAVDSRQLLVSQFPQLGPRKSDPNDASPQFDRDRRISLRFRHLDLAGFVSVVEGRIASHHMHNNAYELTFSKTDKGYVLEGQVHRTNSTTKEEWAVRFENQFAVTVEHFLQSALTESFGFTEYQRSKGAQASGAQGASSPNNSNNNRTGRNNNARNRRNNNNAKANGSSSSSSGSSATSTDAA